MPKISVKNTSKFIEIVPIDYSGTLGILKEEDYLASPANAASDLGYETVIVSTAQLTTGIFLPKSKRTVNNDVKIMRITRWWPYLKFLFRNKDAIIFANDRVARSMLCCFFGKHNIFMSHQSRLPVKWWQRMVFKFFVKRFDAIKVSNPSEKDELVKIGLDSKKIHYIPLSIEYRFFSKKTDSSKMAMIRKKYNIKKDDKVLLFLANVRRFKRVDTVLKAIEILNKKNVDVKLVVVGNDFLKSEGFSSIKDISEKLNISQNIIQTGWLTPEDTRDIMNISDICVNSSIHEGQCLVVYEAACANLPLCVSNIGSFTSVFTDSALFHDPEDANKLAKNIQYYLAHPKIAKQHAIINKKLVKERCDYKTVQTRLKSLIEDKL